MREFDMRWQGRSNNNYIEEERDLVGKQRKNTTLPHEGFFSFTEGTTSGTKWISACWDLAYISQSHHIGSLLDLLLSAVVRGSSHSGALS